MRLLVAFFVTVLVLSGPARADDISVAGRGVVRIVTIASAEGEVVGFGHGSGFAVAPNRVVTNAHVVELAARYPANVVIGVVPSEGDKSYQGRLIAYDAQRDLALIEFKGARLPPVTLFDGVVADGEQVVALGYPGNVDLATAQSAADFIKPQSPVRSQGGFAGRRILTGVQVLLHTASIARGNSGGPLLDRCGRVIGVNSALTKAEDGDSTFGFAIADNELRAFLAAAKQPVNSVALPCTSIEERMRLDKDAAAQAADDRVAAAQQASERATLERETIFAQVEATRSPYARPPHATTARTTGTRGMFLRSGQSVRSAHRSRPAQVGLQIALQSQPDRQKEQAPEHSMGHDGEWRQSVEQVKVKR